MHDLDKTVHGQQFPPFSGIGDAPGVPQCHCVVIASNRQPNLSVVDFPILDAHEDISHSPRSSNWFNLMLQERINEENSVIQS